MVSLKQFTAHGFTVTLRAVFAEPELAAEVSRVLEVTSERITARLAAVRQQYRKRLKPRPKRLPGPAVCTEPGCYLPVSEPGRRCPRHAAQHTAKIRRPRRWYRKPPDDEGSGGRGSGGGRT